MSEHYFQLEPRDLLFMRDARPMEASDAGLGANFPRPDQLWSAIINAFHRQWPSPQSWEGYIHTKRKEGRSRRNSDKRRHDNLNSSDRFGALKTCGPFPLKDGKTYFQFPLDWGMELVPCPDTNLPTPLTHAFRDKELGKKSYPQWLHEVDYKKYLASSDDQSFESCDLFSIERNIGIAIDAGTRSTMEGKLYQAEYLRLERGVSLGFSASCDLKNGTDVFAQFKERNLILGGQQGIVTLNELQSDSGGLPQSPEVSSRFLRWTLLTPAVFRNGWLPDWCVDSRTPPQSPLGTVMLKDCQFAKLIAARIGKPLAFSGWDLQTGPKPTQLAVPAGSCYVFDCGTVENAQQLANVLNPPNRRSSVFGEKGFGIGICSTIVLN